MEVMFFILTWIFKLGWLGLTLFIALNPRKFWSVFQSWKARSQPSNAYFLFYRMFGIIAFLMGLIAFFL